jgi:transcriptional regulator with XRE-family HTH domain
MKRFGVRIKELREKNNHTREQLAKKIGLSESGLGKIERGERNFKPGLLEEIAKIYDVPVSYFYGEEGELPNELREIGVEWITFAKEMKEKKLTPEQIKATLELLETLGFNKK